MSLMLFVVLIILIGATFVAMIELWDAVIDRRFKTKERLIRLIRAWLIAFITAVYLIIIKAS